MPDGYVKITLENFGHPLIWPLFRTENFGHNLLGARGWQSVFTDVVLFLMENYFLYILFINNVRFSKAVRRPKFDWKSSNKKKIILKTNSLSKITLSSTKTQNIRKKTRCNFNFYYESPIAKKQRSWWMYRRGSAK